eukprot:TRINITY_DN8252_c0_g1_i6.p1 TRINITY_DN8252_c0_g1~~TRINITY_DN8252_c0_g1_i6.p1  ORF type:complete len:154 (+),score=27.54 TRINITY_DN8252_c0_g1_i6:109-570(+)
MSHRRDNDVRRRKTSQSWTTDSRSEQHDQTRFHGDPRSMRQPTPAYLPNVGLRRDTHSRMQPDARSQGKDSARQASRAGILKQGSSSVSSEHGAKPQGAQPAPPDTVRTSKEQSKAQQQLLAAAQQHAKQQLTVFKIHLSAHGNTLIPTVQME